jgi:hypothetical protein
VRIPRIAGLVHPHDDVRRADTEGLGVYSPPPGTPGCRSASPESGLRSLRARFDSRTGPCGDKLKLIGGGVNAPAPAFVNDLWPSPVGETRQWHVAISNPSMSSQGVEVTGICER